MILKARSLCGNIDICFTTINDNAVFKLRYISILECTLAEGKTHNHEKDFSL